MDPTKQPTSVKGFLSFVSEVYCQIKFREYVLLPDEYDSGGDVRFHASPGDVQQCMLLA